MKSNKVLIVLLTIFTFMIVSTVLAQTAPSATPALGQGVVNAVNTASSKLPSSLPTWLITGLSFLVTELAARGIPTTKPQSWFIFVSGLIGALVALLQKVQALLNDIGTAFNNVSTPSS